MTPRRARVAILGCRASDDADSTDIYPDDDWPLLRAALHGAGVDATLLVWDREGIDWHRFDAAVIRSTWDSVDRPQEFLAWARHAARATTLMNPPVVLEWNLDKTYLRKLVARGVPVVPTQWVADEAQWVAPHGEFVVKPSVSAGGRQTARYRPDESAIAAGHVRHLLAAGQLVMVQDYVASVDVDGEAKLVFIEGEFSHAVRVGPLLDPGGGVLERPWEKSVSMEAMTPSPEQIRLARRILTDVEAELRCRLLYSRVDFVMSAAGDPLVSEIELIDPSLLLRFAPAGAGSLAQAIAIRARRSMSAHADPPTP